MVSHAEHPYRTPGATRPPPARPVDADLARARTFSRVMDTYMVDPLVGLLLPGIGDTLSSLFGLYLVAIAKRRGVPAIVLARMILNLALDAVLGIIPLVGDLADFALRANTRNLALLEARYDTRHATWRDWAIVLGALAAVLGALVAVIAILDRLVAYAFGR